MLDGITCCGAQTDASTSIAFGTPCGHASRSAQAHLATVKKLRLCSLHLLEVALKLGASKAAVLRDASPSSSEKVPSGVAHPRPSCGEYGVHTESI